MCIEWSKTLDVLCQFNIKKGVADAPDILKEMMIHYISRMEFF